MTPPPTRTPLPTIVLVAEAIPTSLSESPATGLTSDQDSGLMSILVIVPVGALLAGVILAVVVVWLWLRGQGTGRDQNEKDED